jgi:nicotinamide-nucleotide amidase
MTMTPDLSARAAKTVARLVDARLMLATAESCTGGLVAGAITEIAGSSAVLERGFVTYSNEAKMEMLGVPADVLEAHGAVSWQTAVAMAEGVLARSRAAIAVATTGIAGPGGGSAEKPVGLVHFACARRGRPTQHVERRFGDIGRAEIRALSVIQALDLVDAAAQAAAP